jgi:hypothetical protein
MGGLRGAGRVAREAVRTWRAAKGTLSAHGVHLGGSLVAGCSGVSGVSGVRSFGSEGHQGHGKGALLMGGADAEAGLEEWCAEQAAQALVQHEPDLQSEGKEGGEGRRKERAALGASLS